MSRSISQRLESSLNLTMFHGLRRAAVTRGETPTVEQTLAALEAIS